MTGVEADFLQDGAQSAADVAGRLVAFIAEATATIDIAIYDFDARDGRDRADRGRARGGDGARRRDPGRVQPGT